MSKNKKKKMKIESGTHPQFTNILESFANAMTIGTKPKEDERRTILRGMQKMYKKDLD